MIKFIKYEQDPVNGNFYPKKEERFTEEEWHNLKMRWDDGYRKEIEHDKKIMKFVFGLVGLTILYVVAQCIRVIL